MSHPDTDRQLAPLPTEPIARFTQPVHRFLHVEAAGGVVLLIATMIAIAAANSSLGESYASIWKTQVGVRFGGFEMLYSLKHWINDGLMAIFFFVIGLEVKRELALGELRDLRRAALPIAAALGGMVVPAGLYLMLQGSGEASRGWGIPMATDIAFVVGALALMGSRVPTSLRVLLLSLAIADDIGAILVIAIGYTASLDLGMLAAGFAGIAAVALLERLGVRSVMVYALLGVGIWFSFHESGVHATIAGVILGLQTPAQSWLDRGRVAEILETAGAVFRGDEPSVSAVRHVETAAREAVSPLVRLENALHPWVGMVIMPAFAFANAGVPFEASDFGHPVALAVTAGLVVGKPLGILLFSFLAVRSGLAELPEEIGWGVLSAAGLLAGIGFTMSLFIAGLALDGDLLDGAKVGVLGASAVAALAGMGLLYALLPAAPQAKTAGSRR